MATAEQFVQNVCQGIRESQEIFEYSKQFLWDGLQDEAKRNGIVGDDLDYAKQACSMLMECDTLEEFEAIGHLYGHAQPILLLVAGLLANEKRKRTESN